MSPSPELTVKTDETSVEPATLVRGQSMPITAGERVIKSESTLFMHEASLTPDADSEEAQAVWHGSVGCIEGGKDAIGALNRTLDGIVQTLKTIHVMGSAGGTEHGQPLTSEGVSQLLSVDLPGLTARLRRENRQMVEYVENSDKLVNRAKLVFANITEDAFNLHRESLWINEQLSAEESFCAPNYTMLTEQMLSKEEFTKRCQHEHWWVGEEEDPHQFTVNALRYEDEERKSAQQRLDLVVAERVEVENRTAALRKREEEIVNKLGKIRGILQELSDARKVMPLPTELAPPAANLSALPQPLFNIFGDFYTLAHVAEKPAAFTVDVQRTAKITTQADPRDDASRINEECEHSHRKKMYAPYENYICVTLHNGDFMDLPPQHEKTRFPVLLNFFYFPSLELVTATATMPNPYSDDDGVMVDILNEVVDAENDGIQCPNPRLAILYAGLNIPAILVDYGYGQPFKLLQQMARLPVSPEQPGEVSAISSTVLSSVGLARNLLTKVVQLITTTAWAMHFRALLSTTPNVPIDYLTGIGGIGGWGVPLSFFSPFQETTADDFRDSNDFEFSTDFVPELANNGSFLRSTLTCPVREHEALHKQISINDTYTVVAGVVCYIPHRFEPAKFTIRMGESSNITSQRDGGGSASDCLSIDRQPEANTELRKLMTQVNVTIPHRYQTDGLGRRLMLYAQLLAVRRSFDRVAGRSLPVNEADTSGQALLIPKLTNQDQS